MLDVPLQPLALRPAPLPPQDRLSELPSWNADPQAFIEDELARLTTHGEEVVSILPDHEDLLVVLKVLT